MKLNNQDSVPEADALSAEVVADYLREHPDFFLSRQDLVDRFALSHREQGTVSLVEIQMRRQRDRIEALEEEITQLMSLAASNDHTFYQFMTLQEQVLQCHSVEQVVEAINKAALQLGLTAYLRLLEAPYPRHQISAESLQRFSTNHLNGKAAYLGRLRKVDRDTLFADLKVPEMGSFVVMPLVRTKLLGVLAFSSQDGGHFQPNMDTLFLRNFNLVVCHLLESLSWQAEEATRV